MDGLALVGDRQRAGYERIRLLRREEQPRELGAHERFHSDPDRLRAERGGKQEREDDCDRDLPPSRIALGLEEADAPQAADHEAVQEVDGEATLADVSDPPQATARHQVEDGEACQRNGDEQHETTCHAHEVAVEAVVVGAADTDESERHAAGEVLVRDPADPADDDRDGDARRRAALLAHEAVVAP